MEYRNKLVLAPMVHVRMFYMSEVDMGMTLPDYFTAVMEKVVRAEVRRDALLRGVNVKIRIWVV
ncbi:hypothetical protein HanRHA438_Chr05g0213511 [Helianthus annuus]|nr:hypothetical protein HanRHA438_Chr05g0213511 [Helianthus annuus]